eukprot:gene14345-16926_t
MTLLSVITADIQPTITASAGVVEKFSLQFNIYDLTVLNVKEQEAKFTPDGITMMKTRENVNVGGYYYAQMKEMVVGKNYWLDVQVADEPIERVHKDSICTDNESSKDHCKYIRMRVFKDYLKLYSIPEFICYKELPKDNIEEVITKDEFKMLTYNLWNYNRPWRTRRNLIVDIIDEQDPDVIALQEVRYSAWDGESETNHPRLKGLERSQIQHLVNLLSHRNKNTPQIFVGDLNSLPHSKAIQFLVGSLEKDGVTSDFKDMWEEHCAVAGDEKCRAHEFTYPTLQGNCDKRIDYIMTRGDQLQQINFESLGRQPMMTNQNGEVYPSDHVSLVSTFILTK